MRYFIANWKAHKNLQNSIEWITQFGKLLEDNEKIRSALTKNQAKIIICPPYSLLYPLKDKLPPFPNIHIGAQDISTRDEGSFTGEVSGISLQGLVEYAIVGHSERRNYFKETNEDIEKKLSIASSYNIKSILCVRGVDDLILKSASIVAYEPLESIGTGNNAALSSILDMKKKFMLKPDTIFIYGGSVNDQSIHEYLESKEIDGFLVGSASLEPSNFISLISQI